MIYHHWPIKCCLYVLLSVFNDTQYGSCCTFRNCNVMQMSIDKCPTMIQATSSRIQPLLSNTPLEWQEAENPLIYVGKDYSRSIWQPNFTSITFRLKLSTLTYLFSCTKVCWSGKKNAPESKVSFLVNSVFMYGCTTVCKKGTVIVYSSYVQF